MSLDDDLAGAVAAYRHIGALWPQRHQPAVRRWVREYLMRIRSVQDQVSWLAEVMRRERQEQAMRDDETQVLMAL